MTAAKTSTKTAKPTVTSTTTDSTPAPVKTVKYITTPGKITYAYPPSDTGMMEYEITFQLPYGHLPSTYEYKTHTAMLSVGDTVTLSMDPMSPGNVLKVNEETVNPTTQTPTVPVINKPVVVKPVVPFVPNVHPAIKPVVPVIKPIVPVIKPIVPVIKPVVPVIKPVVVKPVINPVINPVTPGSIKTGPTLWNNPSTYVSATITSNPSPNMFVATYGNNKSYIGNNQSYTFALPAGKYLYENENTRLTLGSNGSPTGISLPYVRNILPGTTNLGNFMYMYKGITFPSQSATATFLVSQAANN